MLKERLGKELLFFDGGMGTLLQEKGLAPGELPETWNITHPQMIADIHREYIEAGSDIILTNTFGANALKFHNDQFDLEQIIKEAVHLVHEAVRMCPQHKRIYTALDVGPTGKLLKPMGDLSFDDAYNVYKEVMICGEKAGADLIHIETMSDTYELKAAVLAAKENTSLPVFATVIYDERQKLLTGADIPSVIALLEGLRADAIGINCGMGPEQMIPVLEQYRKYSSLPIIVKPNAGLPVQRDGKTCYDVLPDDFARYMMKLVSMGAGLIGGCCGTTPDHIRKMISMCHGMKVLPIEEKNYTMVSSYGGAVFLGNGSKIIGERINPTGKKRFKQALKEHDLEYIMREGISQQDCGAHILDVNTGLPDIDESAMMRDAVQALQSVVNLPLQIDTVDAKAMEAALRIYNGKAMVNSVSGKQESMDSVFPLIQKYGGVVIGLTLDENGIPSDAEGRIRIAEKIINEAEKYGIRKKDIVIDALAMTISSEPLGAVTTLETLRRLRDEIGVCTVLGVSNISFGLPSRPVINAAFYTMAMMNGLSAGIINPCSEDMMRAWYAYHALAGLDENCAGYIGKFSSPVISGDTVSAGRNTVSQLSLQECIEKGLKDDAERTTRELIGHMDALDVINEMLIPALNNVGDGFEKGTVFLPQLLMSAEAAKSAFAVLKDNMDLKGTVTEKKGAVLLATVKGDIHDIGKNIVKVLLENYSFEVVDLGKDVPPENIVRTVLEKKIHLVGLSALMTTTVVSMEKTITELRKYAPDCRVMVGGAVLNQEYADMIGADYYAKDAMQSVRYAQKLFGN